MFTGQERDGGTADLDYFNARHMSAVLGSFTQPDPANAGADILNPQSWNAYAYVLGNPLALVDPSGLCSSSDNPPCYSVVTAVKGDPDFATSTQPYNLLYWNWVNGNQFLNGTSSCSNCGGTKGNANPSPAKNQTGTVGQPKQTGTYSAYAGCLIGAMPKVLGTSAFGVGLTATAGRSYTNPIPPPPDILPKAPQRTFEQGSKWGVKGQIVGAVVFLATYEVELNAAARSCSNSTGYTPWVLER
jgi:RHS repeat-associated protein